MNIFERLKERQYAAQLMKDHDISAEDFALLAEIAASLLRRGNKYLIPKGKACGHKIDNLRMRGYLQAPWNETLSLTQLGATVVGLGDIQVPAKPNRPSEDNPLGVLFVY